MSYDNSEDTTVDAESVDSRPIRDSEEEGEVEMTNTAWDQQQPDHVVSIEELKLKKRGAP